MTREIYKSDSIGSSGPYSQAVKAGEFVYFSGQTAMNGVDAKAETHLGSITEQTEIVFENLQKVMDAAGVTEDEVVKANVFITSMDYFAEMNAVYGEFFSAPYPARTCVAVRELPLGTDVEIEIIARRK